MYFFFHSCKHNMSLQTFFFRQTFYTFAIMHTITPIKKKLCTTITVILESKNILHLKNSYFMHGHMYKISIWYNIQRKTNEWEKRMKTYMVFYGKWSSTKMMVKIDDQRYLTIILLLEHSAFWLLRAVVVPLIYFN